MATGAVSNQYPILEFVDNQKDKAKGVDTTLSWADSGRGALKTISGSEAFRKYGVLVGQAELNSAGNLRGMVISARWRTVFTFTEKTKGALGDMGMLASIMASLAEAAPQIQTIAGSNQSAGMKAAQYAMIAGTVSLRALTGVVPFGVHLIYLSLEGWARAFGLISALTPYTDKAVATLQSADKLVQTTYTTWTDTQKLGGAIGWAVVKVVIQ